MAKRKSVKYCNVARYLRDTDPELADVVSASCTESSLNSGPSGLTFLLPIDKDVRAKMIDAVYGDKPEIVGDQIRALIVGHAIPSLTDFGPVGSNSHANKLGQYLVVKKITSDYVELGNGAKIRPYKKFSPWDNRQLVIYELEGQIPIDGPAAERSTAKKRRGAGHYRGGSSGVDRAGLARMVEAKFVEMKSTGGECTCYAEAVYSLLKHLKSKSPKDYHCALLAFDYCCPVSFYIYVEPYMQSAGHFISDAALQGWTPQFGMVQGVKSQLAQLLNQDLPSAGGKAGSNPSEVLAAVQGVRGSVTAIDKVGLPNVIRSAYENLCNNSIGRVGGIYSAPLTQEQVCQKLWQDEFRFQMASQFLCLEANFDVALFNQILSHMAQFMPGTNYSEESRLSDAKYWRCKINPQMEFTNSTLAFFSSTDFLYVMVPPAKLSQMAGFTGGGPDDGDDDDWEEESVMGAGCGCTNHTGERAEVYMGGKDSEVSESTKKLAIELVKCISENDGRLPDELAHFCA